MADGQLGFDNLTQYSPDMPPPFKDSKSVWIGQVHHKTYGPKHYIDTINLNMRSGEDGKTILHAYSLSLIGGALGDNGQNYKNIMGLLGGVKFNVTKHLNGSCMPAAAPAFMGMAASVAPAVAVRSLAASTMAVEKQEPAQDLAAPVVGTCGSTK